MSRYRVLKLWITVIIYNQYLVLKNTVFSDVQLYNVSKYNRWLSKLSLLQQLTSCAAMFPCVCKQATNTAAKMTLIMRTKTNINVISSKIQIINCFPQPLKDKRTHTHRAVKVFSLIERDVLSVLLCPPLSEAKQNNPHQSHSLQHLSPVLMVNKGYSKHSMSPPHTAMHAKCHIHSSTCN